MVGIFPLEAVGQAVEQVRNIPVGASMVRFAAFPGWESGKLRNAPED